MPKILLSYWHDDSQAVTSRIYDWLEHAFGKALVVKDVTVHDAIREAVAWCDVILVIVGPQWLQLNHADQRRLDDPADPVRVTVQTGLERDSTRVIPVCVMGAPPPHADTLPLELRELAFNYALHVRNDPDFRHDMERLIDYLNKLDEVEPRDATLPSPPREHRPADVRAAILDFYQAVEGGNLEHAAHLLDEIENSGRVPHMFDPATQRARLQVAIRDAEYDVVRSMLQHEKAPHVWAALQLFWERYPYHDPDDIAKEVRPGMRTGPLSPMAETIRRHPRLGAEADVLPAPFEWRDIPAGEVTLAAGGYVPPDGQTFHVERFWIARYPITNAQFQVFIEAGYDDPVWWDFSEAARVWRMEYPLPPTPEFDDPDLPRADLSWFDAVAFCRWLGARLEAEVRLPTEQQWQRAAQGDDGRPYPWGADLDEARCNFNGVATTPVTRYPHGASPFGVMDLCGNVYEWCLTGYHTGVNVTSDDTGPFVARGGCWSCDPEHVTVMARHSVYPDDSGNYLGFRPVLWRP